VRRRAPLVCHTHFAPKNKYYNVTEELYTVLYQIYNELEEREEKYIVSL
jgi:hypothetical protein